MDDKKHNLVSCAMEPTCEDCLEYGPNHAMVDYVFSPDHKLIGLECPICKHKWAIVSQ